MAEIKKIKVLGISASPRKGNSQFLLEKALEAAGLVKGVEVETSLYSFKGKKFGPCLSEFYCAGNNGSCVYRGGKADDFEELRGLWMEADAIIYSVPVYHMSVPGQFKCFIDRLGNSMFGLFASNWEAGHEFDSLPKLLKVTGNIAQGAHIFSGQESTLTDLVNHALWLQCIPYPGDMWGAYIGVGGWTSGAIDTDAIQGQAGEGQFDASITVNAAAALGQRVVETAALVKAGLEANRDMLADQRHYRPYYRWLDGQGWADVLPWKKD